VLRAGVAALAVDHHAGGQDERACEVAVGERSEQLSGGQVVVGNVVGDVAEVRAEADHRRLVADRVDPVDRGAGDVGVAQVGMDELGGLRETRWDAVVGAGQQRVDDPDLVTTRDKRVGDVRSDEAGAARDEDPHRRSCSGTRRTWR
jgi:hypothetical protein